MEAQQTQSCRGHARAHLLLSIAALSFAPVPAQVLGQESSVTASWDFSAADVRLEPVGPHTQVVLRDGIIAQEPPGAPALPARVVYLVLPAGAAATGLSVQATETLLGRDILVRPAQLASRSDAPPPAFVPPDPAVYSSDTPTPDAWAVIQDAHQLHGYTFVSLRLNPVRYVPGRCELSVATRIEVTLRFSSSDANPASELRTVSRGSDRVAAMVGNPQDVLLFAPSGERTAAPDSGATYLLITSSNLAAAFQPLVDRRTSQGKPGTLLTTEWIYANYDGTRPDGGADDQTRIRNCIKDYYLNHGTVWVALGGDDAVVPDRDASCIDADIPTDLYYGGLDGTWDADLNGIYGEAGVDGVDLLPEVWVGRIPVRTPADAAAYVAKVVRYETAPAEGFAGRILLSGSDPWWSGDDRPVDFRDHDPVSFPECWGNRLLRDHVLPWWQPAALHQFYDTRTTWDSAKAGDYPLSTANYVQRLSEGYQFVLHHQHGWMDKFGLEQGWMGIADALALTNADRPSIFYAVVVCETGAFDLGEPSLGEAFLRNPDGGAVAYIGSSRSGWYNSEYIGGLSWDYAVTFFSQALRYQRPTVGEAFALSKMDLVPLCGQEGYHRYLQFALSLEGDPALSRSLQSPGKTLQVDIPNHREFYDTGSLIPIRWYAGGTGWQAGESIRIEYSMDAGSTWAPVPGAQAVPYTRNVFYWTPGAVTPSTHCRIRVTSVTNASVSDVSDGDFAIYDRLRLMIVQSSGLDSVRITGSHPGTTRYTYSMQPGEPVALTAPSVDLWNFLGWRDANGNLLTHETTLAFPYNTAGADTLVIGEYAPTGDPRDYYANDDVPEPGFAAGDDRNDGLSPQTPVRYIQQILDRYDDIAVIHLSAGLYHENLTVATSDGGMVLRGSGPDQTVIDGGQAGSCIWMYGVYQGTVDGCTLRNGKAPYGAGLYADRSALLTVRNCVIRDNQATDSGGGLHISRSAGATVANSIIAANQAGSDGGGIDLTAVTATLAGNRIHGNTAVRNGAGISLRGSSQATVTGNTVSTNAAGARAGGMSVADGSVGHAANSIFWHNSAPGPTELCVLDGCSLDVGHCDVSGGPGVVHVEPAAQFTWLVGNIDADPLFLDSNGPDDDPATWEDNDLRLAAHSPCIDAGDNAAVPADTPDLDADGDKLEPWPLDLGNRPRFLDRTVVPDRGAGTPPIVDIGADEFLLGGDCNLDERVDAADFPAWNGCLEGPAARPSPRCGCADVNDDGHVDMDDLAVFQWRIFRPGSPDLDQDGDVDLLDYRVLARCLAGPGLTSPPSGCGPGEFIAADLDGSADVDLADFALFLICFNDSGNPPGADCGL